MIARVFDFAEWHIARELSESRSLRSASLQGSFPKPLHADIVVQLQSECNVVMWAFLQILAGESIAAQASCIVDFCFPGL